jgi:hypothetical protein
MSLSTAAMRCGLLTTHIMNKRMDRIATHPKAAKAHPLAKKIVSPAAPVAARPHLARTAVHPNSSAERSGAIRSPSAAARVSDVKLGHPGSGSGTARPGAATCGNKAAGSTILLPTWSPHKSACCWEGRWVLLGVVRWPVELCNQPEVGRRPLSNKPFGCWPDASVPRLSHLSERVVETVTEIGDGPVLAARS